MISKRLKELRSERRLSQLDIAKIAGVTQQAVAKWEKDKADPDNAILITLADYFHTTTDDLLGRTRPGLLKGLSIEIKKNTQIEAIASQINADEEKKKKGILIPVLGSIVAGIPLSAIEEVLGWEEIPESMARGGEYFALHVKGHSMEPKFIEGDTVIVRKESTVDSGRVAVVLIDKEEATLKQVNISSEGITLIGYNPIAYSPHFYSNKEVEELPVQIIGEVVELRRKI